MTLRHLQIYIAVCETGSVTAAANKLFLAQPSVSLAIRELEENYGVKLFDRISRKLYITDTGKQFLEYASHIVSLFDKMETEIRDWELIGSLRIGSSITIGNYLLPGYVKQFKEKYPQIKIQIMIDNSSEIERRLMANEIDFGLIEGVLHNQHIVTEKIMDDELVLVCGSSHPFSSLDRVGVEKLRDQDFILREKGSGGRELFDSMMLIHNIEIEPVWESVSNQAIIKALQEGLGLSVLPYLLVKQDIDSRLLHRIDVKGITFQRELSVIFHENKYLTKAAKDFIGMCRQVG